jgi:hypothetical protein
MEQIVAPGEPDGAEGAMRGCEERREPGGFVLIGTVLQRELLAVLVRRESAEAADFPDGSA